MGLILSGGQWWAVALGLSLGVLPWNYPVAKTFLGDGGSTLLGFLCVSQFTRELPFLLEGKGIVIWLASMLLIGGVPVIDTLFSFARRVIKGSSPFRPDRGHFHHLLSDRGLPLSGVLAILVSIHALSLWMAILLLGRHGT
ncbi:MAG TPA: undecaprenyl/decaprenyl-phosphate alpha-N-acetylglucosaminyl 1-phosphate transferase, partial [Synergistales bacterium]|nr:undecaprenyl/decaprenyl-phosphate alpha-N-acetylglucosaminyl 1-phosphate transferase [Synergistales bacterium]